MMTALTINANALHIPLADASVQCIATSPPYYGLRDYGLPPTVWGGEPECQHVWGDEQIGKAQRQRNGAGGGLHEGRAVNGLAEIVQTQHNQGCFCQLCGAWCGCLGLEPTPELYVAHLVAIGRELRRVLREDGCFWLNLGDSYASGKGTCYNPGGGENSLGQERKAAGVHPFDRGNKSTLTAFGLKPKDLIGIPWRVALALQADGWYLRSAITWCKSAPMPESVEDRPTNATEIVFLLAKSARYYYDAEAVKVPSKGGGARNLWNYWIINPSPFSGAHFATWPPKLVEPMILAGTSSRGCCPQCGKPWERVVERGGGMERNRAVDEGLPEGMQGHGIRQLSGQSHAAWKAEHPDHFLGWRPSCGCDAGESIPCIVLDPFCGSGTTGRVAIQHGRRFIGLDLNGGYLGDLASERMDNVQVRLSL